jgi:hypothetical protein
MDYPDDGEELLFAVSHLRDMVERFRKQWYVSHKEAQSKTEAPS